MTVQSALVSVVIPTRNRAKLLEGALESVWKQTYRPIELVIVDDGSTDTTSRVVSDWARGTDGDGEFSVRTFVQEPRGANAARNRGIRESSGEFVAFLDSDDRWLHEKTSRQVLRLTDDAQIGGVYCGVRNIDLSTGVEAPAEKREYREGHLLRDLLIRDVTAPTSCWMVRKRCLDAVNGFDEALLARQDWDLWIRLSERSTIAAVRKVMVLEGTHSGERIRTDPAREIEAHQTIFLKYSDLRKEFPRWVEMSAKSAMHRRRGRVLFHHGFSWPTAFASQLNAIATWPFDFDSYAALVGTLMPGIVRKCVRERWNRLFGSTRIAIRSH